MSQAQADVETMPFAGCSVEKAAPSLLPFSTALTADVTVALTQAEADRLVLTQK